jgi:hypothetical protein
MSRFFAEPRKIHVFTDKNGQPAGVVWRGRRQAVRVCNHWRIEGEWWENNGVAREYYKVIGTASLILVLYYDRLGNAWYVERVVD